MFLSHPDGLQAHHIGSASGTLHSNRIMTMRHRDCNPHIRIPSVPFIDGAISLMDRPQKLGIENILFCLLFSFGLAGCRGEKSSSGEDTKTDSKALATEMTTQSETEFGIFWPPWVLGNSLTPTDDPLLRGSVLADASEDDNSDTIRIELTLTRPSDKSARIRWNRKLAFPQHGWMEDVRVWDDQKKWLWPNLPFLLRAHGEERVERYGGVDPGKGVDNDFAAILIRPIGEHNNAGPMVSAEWYPANAGEYTGNSVVHSARSDEFLVRLNPAFQKASGKLGVWLIFADFLGARLPKNWPQEREFAGGILAYLEIRWSRIPNGSLRVNIQQLAPESSTGFDWESWSTPPLTSQRSPLEKKLELVIPPLVE